MSLSESDCIIGTVVYVADGKLPLLKGKIIGPPSISNDMILVPIELEPPSGIYIAKFNLSVLLNEIDGLKFKAELDRKKDKLEQEWQTIAISCKEKLDKAALLINEANDEARSVDHRVTDYSLSKDFEDAVSRAGWRTSSWSC